MAGAYRVMTALALALLVIPMVTLGAAAAKLSAQRRDARLSSLALLGATQGQIAGLTVIESAGSALLGVLIGTVAYAGLVPLFGLVSLGGARLGSGLWLPWWWLPLIWLAVAFVAAASALFGLRNVMVTPLGVRTNQQPRVTGKVRLLIAGVLLVVGVTALVSATQVAERIGVLGILIALFVGFGCGVLALDAVGPAYLALRGSDGAKAGR